MNIKKGDTVIVISGKNKGKKGTVLEVYSKDNRVVVEGVNVATHHNKASQTNENGSITKKEAPIHASNVMLIDPETSKRTRVYHKEDIVDGKKKKLRVAKSGAVLK